MPRASTTMSSLRTGFHLISTTTLQAGFVIFIFTDDETEPEKLRNPPNTTQ